MKPTKAATKATKAAEATKATKAAEATKATKAVKATKATVAVQQQQKGWPLADRSAFVKWVSATFGDVTNSGHELFEQQQFVRNFLSHDGPYRGLVLYHGLGSGKSCSAIATAEALRVAAGTKVHVMLPASLRANFVREVQLCGAEMFRRRQAWARVTDASDIDRLREVGWFSPANKKKNADANGYWVPEVLAATAPSIDAGSLVPFDEVKSATDRAAIQDQVESAIQRFHRFWHYNGNSPAEHRLATAPGAFDDSVVIIDEIHNFISNLHPDDTSNGKMSKGVYANLMAAKRCKIVMLSGTPLVNEPVELAWLVNLAHGPVETFKVPLPPNAAGLTDKDIETLSTSPHVHAHWEPASSDVADIMRFAVQLMPDGFVRAPGDEAGTFVVRSPDVERMDSMERIQLAVEPLGVDPDGIKRDVRMLLPSDAEVFDSTFVDYENLQIKLSDVLTRRCIGSISYFRGHDESLYPRLASVQTVKLPLSGRQFTEYTVVRNIERVKEERSARYQQVVRSHSGSSSSSSSATGMRPASRAACTFVFPEGIRRPRLSEIDLDRDDVLRQKTYQNELTKAISAVRERHAEDGTTLLRSGSSSGRLGELSPKFDRVVHSLIELKGKGTAIVYSEFRNTEGIEMLAMAMEANGFERLTTEEHRHVKQTQTKQTKNKQRFIVYDGSEESNALLSLFNNQPTHPSVTAEMRKSIAARYPDIDLSGGNLRGETATALLITRSGSEGISTRNVRQVHIMEPFWHANRAEQVIGRARRAYSHDQLPDSERAIDVYIYNATFTATQAALHGGTRDMGQTSDEHVFAVSERKRKLMLQLQRIMRSAAVDCNVWRSLHERGSSSEADSNKGPVCFDAADGGVADTPLFSSYSLRDDISKSRAKKQKQGAAQTGLRRRRDPLTGEPI